MQRPLMLIRRLALHYIPLFGIVTVAGIWSRVPAGLAQDALNPSPSETVEVETVETAQPGALTLSFRDVSPDHWAYQALLNLAGTYGCISGYPGGTFRGQAAVSRDEFVAAMDACLGAGIVLIESHQRSQLQELDALIDSMEQSLGKLQQLDPGKMPQ